MTPLDFKISPAASDNDKSIELLNRTIKITTMNVYEEKARDLAVNMKRLVVVDAVLDGWVVFNSAWVMGG